MDFPRIIIIKQYNFRKDVQLKTACNKNVMVNNLKNNGMANNGKI